MGGVLEVGLCIQCFLLGKREKSETLHFDYSSKLRTWAVMKFNYLGQFVFSLCIALFLFLFFFFSTFFCYSFINSKLVTKNVKILYSQYFYIGYFIIFY